MLAMMLSTLDSPDDRAFIHTLYQEYERLLFATALKIAPTFHDAEEIVQESLVRLIPKVATLRTLERCTLTAYIVSTVRNTAFNFVRKWNRQRAANEPLDEAHLEDMPQPELSFDELLIASENRSRLAEAWQHLSEADQMVLEGRYFLELSDEELARQFGCKPGSIRVKLTRARRNALKIMLEKGVELL